LKRLEVILDTRLVQRSARGLSLTYSGQTFLVFARRLLQVRDGAVEAAKAEQQALSGNIRVAAPIAIGQNLLATLVSRFIKCHPGVTIEWNLTDDAVDVTSAGYDLWIRAGEVRRDDLIVREIFHVRRSFHLSQIIQ
jgi:DNA-binding transcriptional LysR family regulator